jgi:hypothetical protein
VAEKADFGVVDSDAKLEAVKRAWERE